MGLLSDLASGGIKGIAEGLDTLIGRFKESPSEENAHALALKAMDLTAAARQIEVNKVEAAHRSRWVSGWRPFIGWVCGGALAWTFIGQPMAAYLLAIYSPATPPPPTVDLAGLYPVLLGILGLGTLRTVEKARGISK